MTQARFNKFGKRLPDTGHGCGCELCARSNAPRYERRHPRRGAGHWGAVRRLAMAALHELFPDRRELA